MGRIGIIAKWTIMGLAVCAITMAPVAMAQEVIRKTTDESGFEKQLTEVDLMHQTAAQHMSAGQWEEAISELQNVVKAQPDRVEAWSDLAKCYKELKQFDKAAEAYMAAHELQPGSLDLLSNLGYAQLNADQLDSAVATYEKMLVLNEISYDANIHLAFIYQQQKETDKAIAFYEKALEGKTDDVASMGSLGQLYMDKGEVDKSIAMYERAVEASTDDAQKNALRNKLGKNLIDQKNYKKAAEVYTPLVEADPSNVANQFNLGISLMQNKQHKEAAVHLAKVVELRPDYGQAYQYLAQCYNGTGQYQKAVTTIQKGLPVSDKKAGLYYAWGQSLEKQQMYDEAIDMFRKIVNDPTYGSHAKRQIQRQEDLKKRAQMIKDQG